MEKCSSKVNKMEDFELVYVLPLIVFHSLSSFSTTIINGLVIWSTWRTPSLHSPSRIMLATLSLSDFFLGTVGQPLFVVYCIAALNKSKHIFCITWVINTRVGYSLSGISLMTLAFISVDRFLAIKMKTAYKTMVTKSRVVKTVLLLWFLVSFVVITSIEYLHSKGTTLLTSVLVSAVLGCIIVCYSISFYSLRQWSKIQVDTTAPKATTINVLKYRISLVTMILAVVINLLAYVPLVVILGVGLFVELPNKVACYQYGQLFIALSATVNPLFYLWRMRDLRNAIQQQLLLLRKFVCCCVSEESGTRERTRRCVLRGTRQTNETGV